MQPFETASGGHDSSLFLTRSKQGNTQIVTGVLTPRSVELKIFNSLHEIGQGESLSLFNGEDLSYEADEAVFETAIDENHEHIYVDRYDATGDRESTWMQIAAVQTALLIDDLLQIADDPLIIIPDDQAQAARIGRSLVGLRSSIPPIEFCSKAEEYYPTAQLGKLTSKYLAYRATQNELSNEYGPLSLAQFQAEQKDKWGDAHTARNSAEFEYSSPGVQVIRAESREERLYSWFLGVMGRSEADSAITTDLQEVFEWASNEEHHRVAAVCRGLM